ncbi:BolA family protein [Chthonobacter albigriseus]|uniref:BolA family protein n=1 Tax=Chthonobacter albigriseus TaxID=1683161 RepID=UPI003140A597
MTTRKDRIALALTEALSPVVLEIEDESERHHGHAGYRDGGQTHYRIKIVSEAFVGKTRVARHRLVTDALKGEFDDGMHALAIEARAPLD